MIAFKLQQDGFGKVWKRYFKTPEPCRDPAENWTVNKPEHAIYHQTIK